MRGFTLLEVMIALAIMAGVILTVIGSVNYHLSVASRDREETVAVLLARAKLDDPAFRAVTEKKGAFGPDWPGITWEREITPTEIPILEKLTLTIAWDQERRKLSLVQYQAK